jgi:type II restriction enzyme
MNKLKTSDLVKAIAQLGMSKDYAYYSGSTRIKIKDITGPEGPIKFIRWKSQESEFSGSRGGISTNQLTTVASVFSGKPNYPIHFDRLFSGGGNSRSALETLLLHTPNFFVCYPERINPYTGGSEEKLKHIMWCPDLQHALGKIEEKEYKQIISEVELGVNFDDIHISQGMLGDEFDSIEAKTVHTQMQVALIEIGNALSFQTWIAKNDRSIKVGNSQLGKLKGVIQSLDDVPILYNLESKKAGSLIDCIWFNKDFKHIPAIIEIEHSTGVTSGLTRMLKFRETLPAVNTNFTIVAPNVLRNKVVSEANNLAFRDLKARFMSYSAVRELYGLIQRYSLTKFVDHHFVEPFMERIVEE